MIKDILSVLAAHGKSEDAVVRVQFAAHDHPWASFVEEAEGIPTARCPTDVKVVGSGWWLELENSTWKYREYPHTYPWCNCLHFFQLDRAPCVYTDAVTCCTMPLRDIRSKQSWLSGTFKLNRRELICYGRFAHPLFKVTQGPLTDDVWDRVIKEVLQ